MINLYFNNSYQNSYVGFQYCKYTVGSSQLNIDVKDELSNFEIEKLLHCGGFVCAIGKSEDNTKRYCVYRGLSVSDDSDRVWYINLGIEADERSAEGFYSIVSNLLLDFDGFRTNLAKWFIATPDDTFSYTLDFECVDKCILEAHELSPDEIEFYQLDMPFVTKFKQMMFDMKEFKDNSLLLFVPESTLKYFYKQNPCFESIKKQYVFSNGIFSGLLEHDESAVNLIDDENSNKESFSETESQYTPSRDDSIGEFLENNKHRIELAGKLALGALAAVGVVTLIKKIIRR